MNSIRVLGVDLAIKSWNDNGTAVLEFDQNSWKSCELYAVKWPAGKPTPDAMADLLDTYARANGIAAIGLDGPQGWREANVTLDDRRGVGRLAEFEVKAPGKVGEYGKTVTLQPPVPVFSGRGGSLPVRQ